MGAAASSSSSHALSSKKYDVFINFRGEDTRATFTSHLHKALCQKSIRAYIDYDLPKGDKISQALIQAIEDSSISVVVFSEDYASSKWCLNELVKILQCKRDQGQVVLPVFYKVDPSHVRNQLGTYKDAFAKHERDFMHDLNKVNKWRHALFETANLAGWDSQIYRDESEFIQNIVENILQKINSRYPSALNGLVGIDENCDYIELLLEKAPIIGIWGMGGIGKTAMAKAVFAKISSLFESCCFLENFREESEKHGLAYIREKLLVELLREENLYNSTSKVVGSAFAMRRLSNKKVFIVLDDVNTSKQLEYLAQDYDCLRQGSKVIITTRKKHLLIGRVNEIYEAKPLSYYKSIQLFNLKAFHTNHPKVGYEELSKKAVDYAKGIPLALIVLGSFLFSKTTKEWDSALAKLKKTPHEDIQEVLQLSYDGLNYEEKEIFLDIAFFLKGRDKQYVITQVDNHGFHASIGLRTLVDNALITIDADIVEMHDLIQEMAYEIVRQECIKEPGRRSRLCDSKEVYSVLKNNTGTKAIEGIVLDLSQIRDIQLNADTFKKMTSLRFLIFYLPWKRRSCNVNLPFGLESLSNELRYLQWDGYPLKSLPSTFCPEKLVELCLKNSNVEKLWDGAQDFVKLRRINLGGCKQLIELPDFSKAQNLERVNLSSCESLCSVHSSILSLQKLVSLDLHKCIKLKDLQSESHLKSLSNLSVTWCFSLTRFSLSSEEIKNLELETTGIEILDSSIGRLNKLGKLCLNGSRLKNLPINELCCLSSLLELHLSNCAQVIDELKLHTLFDALQSLRKLYLDGCCNLTELPNNIKHLSMLQVLSLKNCKRLQSLPELPLFIQELDATNCTSLETLHTPQMEESSIGYLRNLRKLRICVSSLENFSIDQLCCLRSLKELTLFGCRKMIDKSKLHIMFDTLRSFIDLFLEGCSNLCEVPDNISNLSSLYLLGLEGSNVESLPTSIKHLSKLDYIYLTNCRRLQSLPELPPFTQYVKATNCTSLETAFPFATSRPRRKYLVESLFLENCLKLKEHSLSCIEEYAYFSLRRVMYINRIGAVCYPGSSVPEWFGDYQTVASSSMTIKLSSAVNNLLGFVFCCVLPQCTSEQNYQSYLKCQCFFEDGDEVNAEEVDDMIITELNGDHVFLWYDPIYSVFILKELIEREDEQGTTCKPELSFQFSVVTYSENYEITKQHKLIKACGVRPIYASEYHSFLQQMELGKKSKRGWEIDEPSVCGIMEYATFSLEQAIHVSSGKSIMSYPETRIPEWFTYKNSAIRGYIFVRFAPNFDNLLGFVFCFVIPQFSTKEKDQSHSGCRCWYGNGLTMEGPRGWHYSMTALNSKGAFLWYDPLFCELILEKVRRDRGNNNDEGTSYNNNPATLRFEFEFGNGLIEECGVRPIYASEYDNFLQQKEMKVEVGAKTKRHRDDEDEEEQFRLAKKFKEACIVHPVPLGSMASQNIDELLLPLSQLKLESSKNST